MSDSGNTKNNQCVPISKAQQARMIQRQWQENKSLTDNQTKFLLSPQCGARATHNPTSSANQQNTVLKKYEEKPF
jgi:hypothetical protein